VITVEVSEIINRPIEEVFTFVADERNTVRWQDGLIEVKVTPDGPTGVGTQVHQVRKFMGRRIESTAVITEFIPNSKSVFKTLEGPTQVEGYTAFEPVDGGTRITGHMEMKSVGFMAVAEPLVSSGLRRGLQKNLGDLKDLLESGVLAAP
jgi:hypothetical protein